MTSWLYIVKIKNFLLRNFSHLFGNCMLQINCACRIRSVNTLLSNPPSLSARQMQVKGSPSLAPNYLLQPSLHHCNSHYRRRSHSPWPNPLPSIMHQFIYKVYSYSTHQLMNLKFQESIQTGDMCRKMWQFYTIYNSSLPWDYLYLNL